MDDRFNMSDELYNTDPVLLVSLDCGLYPERHCLEMLHLDGDHARITDCAKYLLVVHVVIS